MSWLHYITSHFLRICSDCLALLLVEQRHSDMGTNTQSQVSLYVFYCLSSFTAHKLMFYIGSSCHSQRQEVCSTARQITVTTGHNYSHFSHFYVEQ